MNMPSPINISSRREYREKGQKFRTGVISPLMAVPFLGGESGLLRQTVTFELDKVQGDLLSNIFAEVTAIYVPIQAIDAIANAASETAGITEILRRKVMDGTPLFSLENEGEISKRLNVNPRSISGQKRVSSIARIAYNVAVNHLRKRRYIYAELLEANNTALSPAIISETVLDRFNAALDPDEHINGNVKLRLSDTNAHVKGITQLSNGQWGSTPAAIIGNTSNIHFTADGSGTSGIVFKRLPSNPSTSNLDIHADLSEVQAEGFSLIDLYNAESRDKLVRRMRDIAEANPEDGEDAVLRWVYGLSTDTGQNPFVIFSKRQSLVDVKQNAVDAAGMLDDVRTSHLVHSFDFNVVVPRTELGGVVITVAQVTPDEYIDSMPHPLLTEDWSVTNRAAASMKMDPEIVNLRDMFSDIAVAADETDPVFYTGHNALRKNYIDYGFSRIVDEETVENKTIMWNYAIPAGVTPQNILYPTDFVQYPWTDQLAEVVMARCISIASVATPMFFGPSPVETVAIVDSENLLGEEE